MNTSLPQNIYFVGAGGIGMAALERFCLAQGLCVGGYDRTQTPLTDELRREGVLMTFSPAAEDILPQFRSPENTLVVYTPAVPADHEGLCWFRDNGFRIVKRAQLLGLLTDPLLPICFAGTHGKTTTSTMCAHLLTHSKTGCNAFLGGESANYGTNLLLCPDSRLAVVEADEYDRSFHRLHPFVAVITSADPDHLDIYGTEQEYLHAFRHFTELIRPGGALVIHTGLKMSPNPPEGTRIFTYGLDSGDFHAENIDCSRPGDITFDLVKPDGTAVRNIRLGSPSRFNIDNAIAAIAATEAAGVTLSDEQIRSAMASFRGAHRRFEILLQTPERLIVDDYAHHPREIEQAILSARNLFPGRLTVAFQPHLYSRTRDFAADFGRALSGADSLLLLDIYPAREEPIPGVTSELILDACTAEDKHLLRYSELVPYLRSHPECLNMLLIMGAGDISALIPQILSTANEV